MPCSNSAPIKGAPTSVANAPTGMFGRDEGIPASTTKCMDAEQLEFIGEGLAFCTSTSRLASSNVINKNHTCVKSIQPILMEEETTPLSVLPARVAARAPFVPSLTSTAKKTRMEIHPSTASNSLGNNQVRVMYDSKGLHNSSQALPGPCTNSSQTVTGSCKLTGIFQMPQAEPNDPDINCMYVNIPQSNKSQTASRKDAHDSRCRKPAQAGSWPSWSRVVKQETPWICIDESWPPLLPSPSATTSKNIETVERPLINAHRHDDKSNFPHMENPSTMPLLAHREVVLDEQCWPYLKNFNKRNVLHNNYSMGRKSRTLQPLDDRNICKAQDQKRIAHGGLFKAQNISFPPILLMVNKDFIVTSPLKQNLLLTLALMGKRRLADASEDACMQNFEGANSKRQILVGQFKAFSSFVHFMLGQDARRVRMESNAGGTSTISESLSVEYFVRRFQAKDIVTEMEVEYCSFNWKKVDFICTLYGQRVGVSVTRAMSFPDPKDFSTQMAYRLLHKKLFGLVVARHGVSNRHSFSQCILHVWCETQQTASLMQREYDAVSRELDIADDVVMVLTVADGYHARPIFYEYLLRNESK